MYGNVQMVHYSFVHIKKQRGRQGRNRHPNHPNKKPPRYPVGVKHLLHTLVGLKILDFHTILFHVRKVLEGN